MSEKINRHFKLISISSLIVVIAIVWFTASAVTARPNPTFYFPPSDERILYWVAGPTSTAEIDALPISMNELRVKGVEVVHDFSSIRTLVDNGTDDIDAIVLHQSKLDELAQSKDVQTWIQTLYRSGIVIGGVNVTMHELAKFVDEDFIANDPAWSDGWQRPPFFSVIDKATGSLDDQLRAKSEGRILGTVLSSTDNIRSPEEVESFLSLIRRDIAVTR